jgi:transcriptional regulator with XRE-family HTH domain
MVKDKISYGVVRDVKGLGEIARAHRKSRGITLDKISGLANLGIRFLSEFERGKETAEIGKVFKALNTLGLEVIVQPRKNRAEANIEIPVSVQATGKVRKPGSKT